MIFDLKFLRLVSLLFLYIYIFLKKSFSVFPNVLPVEFTNFPWNPSFPAVFTPLEVFSFVGIQEKKKKSRVGVKLH